MNCSGTVLHVAAPVVAERSQLTHYRAPSGDVACELNKEHSTTILAHRCLH